MRKSYFALTMGITAAVMLGSGCSTQSQEPESSSIATEPETTTAAAQTPEETGEEETTQEESGEAESEEETVPEDIPAPGIEKDIPLKIWGTVTEVTNRAIYVDNQSPNSSEGEFILTVDPETTRILDGANGFPVDMKDIEIGGFEAYLQPIMTMSLPPQAMPYVVIVNTPEDQAVAQYVIAADSIQEENGEKVLAGNDGTEYTLDQEVSIIPFLTRQTVQLEDIEGGSECLVWLNEEEKVERIVLFND